MGISFLFYSILFYSILFYPILVETVPKLSSVLHFGDYRIWCKLTGEAVSARAVTCRHALGIDIIFSARRDLTAPTGNEGALQRPLRGAH